MMAIVFVYGSLPAYAASRAAQRRQEAAKDNSPAFASAILVEAQTGQILFEQDAHKQWPPASLTKMMLMLIVIEKVKQGAISLNDPITVSAKASKIGGSQVYLKEGESFSLEEMMKAVVIHSANDASEAVAERIGGSPEAFVEMMNQKGKELGLKETHYASVHGLPPDRGQPSDLTSAYDVALLARQLVKFPEILKWASILKEPFREGRFVLENTNHLIGKFPGADGLKTGSYHEAGFNLAATAQRNGLRLISVTLGSPRPQVRFREASRLLAMGFNQYQMLTLMKAGEALPQELLIKGGEVSSIHPILQAPALVLVKRARAKDVKYSVELNDSPWAPLRKGDRLGELIVTLGDKPLGRFPLISNQDINQSHIVKRLWDRFF
ncbi:MAG: D-alanyl-D-alanine carboxypeptidase family protein [Candidatus Binatia bacterium]